HAAAGSGADNYRVINLRRGNDFGHESVTSAWNLGAKRRSLAQIFPLLASKARFNRMPKKAAEAVILGRNYILQQPAYPAIGDPIGAGLFLVIRGVLFGEAIPLFRQIVEREDGRDRAD